VVDDKLSLRRTSSANSEAARDGRQRKARVRVQAKPWGLALQLGDSSEARMRFAMTDDKNRRWKARGLVACALLWIGPAFASEDRPVGSPIESIAELPQLDPGDPKNSHRVVLITADSLNPAAVRLRPGQLIAWISYSPGVSTLVFEREVARSMICHSRVNFAFEQGELRSAPIRAGEFASFCQLAPGRYRYKVVRTGAHASFGVDAKESLEGEIIVAEE
jgi:hypothetical protein